MPSAHTTPAQIDGVRSLIAAIPPGRVATYGDIAAAAGLSTPRTVGWIVRTDAEDLPWHRVVPASGVLARAVARRQAPLLVAEGIPVQSDRIPLSRVRYRFGENTPKR